MYSWTLFYFILDYTGNLVKLWKKWSPNFATISSRNCRISPTIIFEQSESKFDHPLIQRSQFLKNVSLFYWSYKLEFADWFVNHDEFSLFDLWAVLRPLLPFAAWKYHGICNYFWRFVSWHFWWENILIFGHNLINVNSVLGWLPRIFYHM